MKLVISDAHEGLKAAITRVVGANWQRCRVHFMRNALAHVPKGQNTMAAAAIRQVFLQPDHAAATQTWRHVADQLRARWPKLGACMDNAEHDVLAYMTFPDQHRVKLHSTNPLERLNKEVKRRADVVGIFPNEDSITRLIGAVLLEQNYEYQLQNRYMQIEGMAALATPQIEEVPPLQITPKAAGCCHPCTAMADRSNKPNFSGSSSTSRTSCRIASNSFAPCSSAGSARRKPVIFTSKWGGSLLMLPTCTAHGKMPL